MKQALKTPFKLVGIQRIDDTPTHKTLREALANCLTNANFAERRGVVCLWTEDALILENPGDFHVDFNEAQHGGTPDPRNATLLKMFSFIDIGERAGSGIPSIIRNWCTCGYDAPRWEESFGPDRTKLILPLTLATSGKYAPSDELDPSRFRYSEHGIKELDSAEHEAARSQRKAASGKRQAERRRGIVDFIEASGSASTSEVAGFLGLSAQRTRRILAEMAEEGMIVPSGNGKARRYRLPQNLLKD